MKIKDLEKNESGIKEILSILKIRRIDGLQFAQMLGLSLNELERYLTHPERMPDVIWLGITTFLSNWQGGPIEVNRQADDMLAYVDRKIESCKECSKELCKRVVRLIYFTRAEYV